MTQYYVGVDIGGTNVRIVIAQDDKLLIKVSSKTVKKGPIEAVGNQICNLIEKGIDELGINKSEIKGIGTSSAGPFVDGTSLSTPNICGIENDWHVIPYTQVLSERFSNKMPFPLANDCVSAIKAESIFGAAKGYKNAVYLTVSTGIGTGIISDGVLLLGKGKNAGHFGHTIVQKDGYQCGCGQKGCIETIISGPGIARRAMEAGLVVPGKSVNEINSKDVFDLYRKGNKKALKLITETIEYLGLLLINIINVTDTQIIVIGGSVFLNNADILLEGVENYIAEHSMVVMSEGVEFKLPKLGKYVGDLAGLSLVIPENWIEKWQEIEPWKNGVEKEIFMTTEESINYK